MPASENYGHLPARVARACSHLEADLGVDVESSEVPVMVRALQITEKLRLRSDAPASVLALAEFAVARAVDLNEDDPTELSAWARATGAPTIGAMFDSPNARELSEQLSRLRQLLREEGNMAESLGAEATRLKVLAASASESSVVRLIFERAQTFEALCEHALIASALATRFEYGFGIADRGLLAPKPWRGLGHRERESVILDDLKRLAEAGLTQEVLAQIWFGRSDADAKRRLARSLPAESAGTSKKS